MTYDLEVQATIQCDECGDDEINIEYSTDRPGDGITDIQYWIEMDGWRMNHENETTYCPQCVSENAHV